MSLFPERQAKVSNPELGSLFLDNVTEESHHSELVCTENPVENGSVITDHQFLKPKQVTISGIIVNYEPFTKDLAYVGSLPIPPVDDVLSAIMSRDYSPLIPSVEKIVGNKLGQFGLRFKETLRQVAPWLPDVMSRAFNLSSDNDNADRIRQKLEELEKLQRSGKLIKIETSARTYEDMAITGLVSTTRKNSVLEVVISAKQIILARPQTVSATGLTGGAADLSVDKDNKGKGKKTGEGDDVGPEGKGEAPKAKKTGHQSVVERMRGQVEAEKTRMKGRLGF